MFWRTTLMLAALCFGVQYFIEIRDWLDLNKQDVLRTAPGPCQVVMEDGGSEDMVHIGNSIVLITQGIDFLKSTGSMKALDLQTNRVMTLNITNRPGRTDFMAFPHGMTTWRDPDTDQLFVYVLTHPQKEDRIEVFELSSSLTLNYIKTITDPNFAFMNNLVAVGKDKFYITKYWYFRQRAFVTLETYVRWSSGCIMYYDGHKAHEVASGYFLSNGINVSPDKSMVYMAEFGYKKLHGFRREASNNLVKAWEVNVGTAVDNIDVDPNTGDIWIGCHPRMYKILDFYELFGFTLPSQVLRFKIRDNVFHSVEQIYADDGRELAGSTVAIYTNGKLVIGSVFSQTVVCDVKYLSP